MSGILNIFQKVGGGGVIIVIAHRAGVYAHLTGAGDKVFWRSADVSPGADGERVSGRFYTAPDTALRYGDETVRGGTQLDADIHGKNMEMPARCRNHKHTTTSDRSDSAERREIHKRKTVTQIYQAGITARRDIDTV